MSDSRDPTVSRIRECLAAADASHAEAAKLMRELQDQGWAQRRIAKAVGCSQATVSRHVRWIESPEPRPPYGEWQNDQVIQRESEDRLAELRQLLADEIVTMADLRDVLRTMYRDRAWNPGLMARYDCSTFEAFARCFMQRERGSDLRLPWKVDYELPAILAATDDELCQIVRDSYVEQIHRMGALDAEERRWIIETVGHIR